MTHLSLQMAEYPDVTKNNKNKNNNAGNKGTWLNKDIFNQVSKCNQ